MDEQKPPNYLAWALATAAGVIIAYFAIRQYEIYQAKQMLKQIAITSQQQNAAIRAQSAQIQQQALAAAEAQRVRTEAQQQEQIRQARQRRAGDSTGVRLSRQCDEWTRTADNMKKSDFALQEKAKFCGQLEAYVNYGTHPRP